MRPAALLWASRRGFCDALDQVQRRQHEHFLGFGLDLEEVALAELAKNIREQQLIWMVGDGDG
jgi:hypothetical protein